MRLHLVGLPRAGKSTSGLLAAERLGWSFTDLDLEIEKMDRIETGRGRSCREIHQNDGETAFRRLEGRALTELCQDRKTIIALGGGVCACQYNRKAIQQAGKIVYMKHSATELWKRVEQDLPIFLEVDDPKQAFLDLAAERHLDYLEVADIVIDVSGLCKNQVAEQIIAECETGVYHGE